jgi:DNA-binding transcriptional MerR regulator
MAGSASELTIDQLAQQTGMSARNIRAHQSRGLLAPPALHGRTGYYSDGHVARIGLIQRLQEDGFSLALIQRLLRSADGSTEELLRLSNALHEPFGDEQPRVVAIDELERRFRTSSKEVRSKLEQLGMLRWLGGGRLEEVTPRAFEGGEMLAELGADAEELLAVVTEARRHMDSIATRFLRLFVDHVWKPFEEAGQPQEGIAMVVEMADRMRPLASATALSMFEMAMRDAAEKRFGSELKRLEVQQRG